MKFKDSLLIVFISAFLLTILFYEQGIGLNLVLFEILFLVWLVVTKQINLKTKIQIVTTAGFIGSSIFTLVTYSVYGYVVHFLSAFIFVGVLNYSKVKSLTNVLRTSITTLILSQDIFYQKLFASKIGGRDIGGFLWRSRIFVAPVLIIFVYSFSNPVFSDLVGNVGLGIEELFIFIFEDLNIWLLLTFLLCLIISVFLLVRTSSNVIAFKDQNASELLTRRQKRFKRTFKLNALKNEYKAGLFLFLMLNTVLLIVNIIDVHTVWFNFEWEGQTLKQFVHEGTYLLIVSILISISLVLYFFRGNLNFFKQNKLLKYLSYIWLIQNAILTISVAIRNFWYIEHFAMAFKRIGVIIFLCLVLYGLYTVFRKIEQKKSVFYLFKSNAFAIYVVLIITSFINWDSFIARYNFTHANHSYLHLEYLIELSDKALPHLQPLEEELVAIEKFQKKKFTANPSDMSYIEYQLKIKNRKEVFKRKWETKNILSWNLAEYSAYQSLFK